MPDLDSPVVIRESSTPTTNITLTTDDGHRTVSAVFRVHPNLEVMRLEDGDLVLRWVEFDESSADVKHDTETIHLSARDGGIFLGGRGSEGKVLLFPKTAVGEFPNPKAMFQPAFGESFIAQSTVELSADGGLAMFGGNGKTQVEIRNDGPATRAVFGGSGKPGVVAVLPDYATGSEQATILLDGSGTGTLSAGTIRITEANANGFLHMITGVEPGRVFTLIGGHGRDGLIALHNASNDFSKSAFTTATIILDGASGDITLRNADCAEEFESAPEATLEPGTVVVLDDAGRMRECTDAYDARVAGVVSGAGGNAPALVLGRTGESGRVPIALAGKIYCKVDATRHPIRPGDLLTTSATPGHAMRVVERERALGTVLGKALAPAQGLSLVPVLVTLQ